MSNLEFNKLLSNNLDNYTSPIGLVVGLNPSDANLSKLYPNIINNNNIIKEELYLNLVKTASYDEKQNKAQNKAKQTKKQNNGLPKKPKKNKKTKKQKKQKK